MCGLLIDHATNERDWSDSSVSWLIFLVSCEGTLVTTLGCDDINVMYSTYTSQCN